MTISLGLSLVQPFSALAGTITFNDSTESLSFTDTTGRASSVLCISSPEICVVDLVGPAGGFSQPSWGPFAALNIFEQDGQTISDILSGSAITIAFFSFVFNSDPTSFDPSAPSIIENGDVQEFGHITWTDVNGAIITTDTIQFQSDIDPPAGVPEPGTLALFAVGVVALQRFRRRRAIG